MALEKLTELLDQNHIRYMTILHSPAYTSQEIAEDEELRHAYLGY